MVGIFMEDKMSEIKKGDWVYYAKDGMDEKVFWCDYAMDSSISGHHFLTFRHAILAKRLCHRLEPLKPGDKLELGDRVAVVARSDKDDPELGTIHMVVSLDDNKNYPIINSTKSGHLMHRSELARLPDYAQDRRSEPEDSKKETHWVDDVLKETEVRSWYEPLTGLANCYYCGCERTIGLNDGDYPICESCATLSKEEREEVRRNRDNQPIPYVLNKERCQPSGDDSIYSDTVNLEQASHCPYPKYDGSTWDYCGEGFKIFWENNKWTAHSIKPSGKWNPSFPVHSDPLDLVTEEDSFWRLVELAPQQSTPGKKLERPRKHGGIKTPWNPWEI
jgi:hypothetical protein